MTIQEQPCKTEFLPLRSAMESLRVQNDRLMDLTPKMANGTSTGAPRLAA
jgi:hypothetical protein